MTPFRRSLPAILALAALPGPAQPRAVEFTLANGLRVSVRPDPGARAVTAALAVPSDASRDGLGFLAPLALRLGGGGLYGYRDVDEQVEGLGASLEGEGLPDAALLRMRVFSRDLGPFLNILGSLLASPIYPDLRASFARGRREAVQDPQALAFSALLGGEGSAPWRKAGMAELKAWHQAHWVPSKARLLVTGPVDPESLRQQLAVSLGAWKAEGPAAPPPPATPVRGGLYLRRDPAVAPAAVLAGVPCASEAEAIALALALEAEAGAAAGPGWRGLRSAVPAAQAGAEAQRLRDVLARTGQQGLGETAFKAALARWQDRRRVEALDPETRLLREARAAVAGATPEPTREGVNALLRRLLRPEEIRVLVVGDPKAPLPGAVDLKD
ncbi:MAG: hypothetical protein U0P81_06370 [Holophagaceae bacterium]